MEVGIMQGLRCHKLCVLWVVQVSVLKIIVDIIFTAADDGLGLMQSDLSGGCCVVKNDLI